MTAIVDESGIPRVHPALRRLGRGGRLRVAVVAHEHPGRAVQHLARVGDLQLDPRGGRADGVGVDLAVGLGGDVDARLGLAVELLQVDAERAVEAEDVRPDRFPCGVGDARAREAEAVPERAVDEPVAESVVEPRAGGERMPVEDRLAVPAGHADEVIEHGALEAAGVLHRHRDRRQEGLEHARRGEEVGRRDLATVHRHGVEALGAADAVAGGQRLPVGEDVIPHPGERQVGDRFLVGAEAVEGVRVQAGDDQVVVGEHDPLRPSRGARGVEDHAHRLPGQPLDALAPDGAARRVALAGAAAELLHVGEVEHTLARVPAQPARLVVDQRLEGGQLAAHRRHLVDLLLILADREADPGVIEHVDHLLGHRVRVDRHRNAAGGLHGGEGPVETRAVRPDDRHPIALAMPSSRSPSENASISASISRQVHSRQMPRSLCRIATREPSCSALRRR